MCYDHFISNVDPDRSWLKIHSFLLLLLSAAPYTSASACMLLLAATAVACCCRSMYLPTTLMLLAAANCMLLRYTPCMQLRSHWNLYALQTTLPPPLFTQQALFRPNLAIRQSRLNHKTKGPTSWELQRKRKRWFPTQLFPPHQGKTKGLRAIVLADFHCTSHVDSLVACHN